MLKVAIVGGVAAGMSCAAKLKRLMGDRVDITVFEQGDVVSYAACGIPYYASGHIDNIDELIERTAEQFGESGIKMRLRHRVTRVDTAEKLVEGVNVATDARFRVQYDKLVVASGARARRLPPLDEERENLFEVRDVCDAASIRAELARDTVRNVVVVGAGFIGMEMAEACARQGKQVTLVEFAPRVLSVFDAEFTDMFEAELTKNGVAVRMGTKASALHCRDRLITAVEVERGGVRETIPADLVLNSVGISPNTGFIDVDKAENGAIKVNERMETSAPDVYAGGDCTIMTSFITGRPQYAPLGTNANKQGKIIAAALAGEAIPTLKLLGSSAVRLFGLDAAKVGLSEDDARRLELNYKTHSITGNSYASYYGDEKLTIKLVYESNTRMLLGAQTVGAGIVVPRANYFAIAISAGMTVDDFGYTDLCYSPPFSGVWDASLIAATSAK